MVEPDGIAVAVNPSEVAAVLMVTLVAPAEAAVVVGEGGIQLARLQGTAELLQQRCQLRLDGLLLGLEHGDAIEHGVEGGASQGSVNGGGAGSHQREEGRHRAAPAEGACLQDSGSIVRTQWFE